MFFRGKHTFGYLFVKTLKFNKKIGSLKTSKKIQNFDDVNGFCSPEFDSFIKDLSIFRLKCNERHSSIPKGRIKIMAMFS